MGLLLLFINLALANSLALRWAPTIQQELGSEPRADEFTRVNYDGDWDAENNWDNLLKFPRPATLYYHIIESENFYFITYALFFPRDYADFCFWMHCHENDFEGLRVTIKKPETLWRLETLAHNRLNTVEKPQAVDVMVERGGHGIYPRAASAPMRIYQPQDYQLISLDEIWERRKTELFRANATFAGKKWIVWGLGAAKPPWSWEMWGSDWKRGEWFLHPLKGMKEKYLHHPYLED